MSDATPRIYTKTGDDGTTGRLSVAGSARTTC